MATPFDGRDRDFPKTVEMAIVAWARLGKVKVDRESEPRLQSTRTFDARGIDDICRVYMSTHEKRNPPIQSNAHDTTAGFEIAGCEKASP